MSVPVPFREAEVEALSHADANAYRVHNVLAFAQVTRTQQLPTKNHASAELPGEKNLQVRPDLKF